MMSGTQNSIKLKRLKGLLKIPQYAAVGILESMWLLAIADADEGEIGKFTNEEFAAAIEWDGDPDELVKALVDARWLDEDETYRLVIHDWIDHAPKFIKERVRKRNARKSKSEKRSQGTGQVRDTNGTRTGQVRDNGGTGVGQDAACPVYTRPNQTRPNSTKQNPEQPDSLVSGILRKFTKEDWKPKDLEDTERLLKLYTELSKAAPDAYPAGEDPIKKFIGAAVRALSVGKDNPVGLFRTIIEKRKWDYVNDDHLQIAIKRYNKFYHPPMPQNGTVEKATESIGQSVNAPPALTEEEQSQRRAEQIAELQRANKPQ